MPATQPQPPNVVPVISRARRYPLLLAASLRVVVYNGDWDACVPYTGERPSNTI